MIDSDHDAIEIFRKRLNRGIGSSAGRGAQISAYQDMCNEASQIIAELRSKLAKAEKDAARLDFIGSRCRADPRMDGNHVYWPTTFNHRLTGPNLRAAIDAAMAKESDHD